MWLLRGRGGSKSVFGDNNGDWHCRNCTVHGRAGVSSMFVLYLFTSPRNLLLGFSLILLFLRSDTVCRWSSSFSSLG